MPEYGMTDAGLLVRPDAVIRAEMNADLKSLIGVSIDYGDTSALGGFLALVADRLGSLERLAEAVYANFDPSKATGDGLRSLCAITGTYQRQAAASTVVATLTGVPATLVPAGHRAKTSLTGVEFSLDAAASIVALPAWAATTAYVVGDRVTATSRAYHCTIAGTSSSTAPSTTDVDITDGTVHWRYLGEGTGAVDVETSSVDLGPISALSGELDTISTPEGGWSSVTNLLDADLGRTLETMEQLALRRVDELFGASTSTHDAIRARLLKVAGVTSCRIFANRGAVTDSDGVPGHAIEALIEGGSDQDIFDELLEVWPDGIGYHGGTAGTATDSQGTDVSVAFSRPTLIQIWIIIDIVVDAAKWPVDGPTQVKSAIVAWGDAQSSGKDVVSIAIAGVAMGVTGALDITRRDIGVSASPTSDVTIAISTRERATYDTSRITVNVTTGEP